MFNLQLDIHQRLFGVLTERSLVGDDRPGFFLCEYISLHKGRHTGAGTPVLDDPEELPIVPLFVKLAVREVAGTRRQ